MSRNRKAIVVSLVCLGLALLAPQHASADLLVWDLFAECPAGKKEVKLKMNYSAAGYWSTEPIKAGQTLSGCGGACKTPGALSTTVDWKKTGRSCYCLPSGTVVSSEGQCPPNNYAKCTETVEATLPYSCDELGYDKICIDPTCKAADAPYGGGEPCAELKPPATANQCLSQVVRAAEVVALELDKVEPLEPVEPVNPADPAELDELGGCSVGTANASLLTLLLLVAGLSLLLSRKRRS